LGGALLGGFGGHEYARKRTKSDIGEDSKKKYKDGVTVHSSWGIER
jgi:hypothetical protein